MGSERETERERELLESVIAKQPMQKALLFAQQKRCVCVCVEFQHFEREHTEKTTKPIKSRCSVITLILLCCYCCKCTCSTNENNIRNIHEFVCLDGVYNPKCCVQHEYDHCVCDSLFRTCC